MLKIISSFLLALIASFLCFGAEFEIKPFKEIKKGDKGYGLTVFSGDRAEKFDFEVIGIYKGFPDYIMVFLSGGPKDKNGKFILENANIISGMSGSPLFIDDKIIGSIAAAMPFAKEPYAFATPIEWTLNFTTKTMQFPNKFISAHFDWPGMTDSIKPGDTYIFCEVWGSDSVCTGGTIIMPDPANPEVLYTLGHSGLSSTGVMALPFWKSEVLAVLPSFNSSTKVIQKNSVGPMLGSIIFNGPFGQVANLGSMPKFIPFKVVLENILTKKLERNFFLAYTPYTHLYVVEYLLSNKALSDSLIDLRFSAKITVENFGEINISSPLVSESALTVGQIIKTFITEELNPIITSIEANLVAMPKYKNLELVDVSAKATQNNDDDPLKVELKIVTNGNEEWTLSTPIDIDKKYKGKQLIISSGEVLLNKILPSLQPNASAIELLNKISDRAALYLWYKEGYKKEESQKDINPNNGVVIGSAAFSNSIFSVLTSVDLESKSKQKDIEEKKETGVDQKTTQPWQTKNDFNKFEIIAKIDLASQSYIIKGEKAVVLKVDEKVKNKKKKFWIF